MTQHLAADSATYLTKPFITPITLLTTRDSVIARFQHFHYVISKMETAKQTLQGFGKINKISAY